MTTNRTPPNKNVALATIEGKALRYCKLREEEKGIKSEKDKLSASLKEAAESKGVKEPAAGSSKGNAFTYVLDLPSVKVCNVAVVKTVVDHEAALKVLFARGGQKLVDRCTRRTIDEQALAVAFQEGVIDMADIDSFSTEEVSRRIDVRDK